jgi:lipopolysaccharide/colanic/teichoic acid biosynthesis glycosyltransferase
MIRYNPHIKRGMDILLSSAALFVLSPLLACLCILICIESAGGAFFFQRRIGKGMELFRLIKFRSMRQDRNALLRQFEPGERGRVTRLGELLRKAKLDELPELFNVLFGDMSIVGPRPEVERYIRFYPDEFRAIFEVRPGLSDYASIKYRNEEEILAKAADADKCYVEEILPDKLRLAAVYVQKMSLKTDMEIITNTLASLLHLEV